MSQENVEIVRRAFEGFERGELTPEWDPEVGVVAPPAWPEGGEIRGLDEWRRQVARLRDSWEHAQTEIDRIEAVDDRVVTCFRYVVATERGLSFDTPMGAIHTLRDGTIVHVEFFNSHQEALEAAGLSE